jgi:3-deoxy-D-manno-octulosonate 8-phosphate phosphatase (KDO 8-P phosphatase)
MDAAKRKAAQVKLMGFDVDGVLTDGSLYYTSQGDEMKVFSSADGHGLKMLAGGGVRLAIITGRTSRAVELRAQNLGIDLVLQGVDDKRLAMSTLLSDFGLGFEQAGYAGDDVVDLPLMRACGFSATVADAHPLVRQRADFAAGRNGGRGAVREICEFILAAQGKLDDALAAYLA